MKKVVLLLLMLLPSLYGMSEAANNPERQSLVYVCVPYQLRDAQLVCDAYIKQYPKYGDFRFTKIEARTVEKRSGYLLIKGMITYDGLVLSGRCHPFEMQVKFDNYDNLICKLQFESTMNTFHADWKVVSVD